MPTLSTENIPDIHLLSNTAASAAENGYIASTVKALTDKVVNLYGPDYVSFGSYGTSSSGSVSLGRVSNEYDELELAELAKAIRSNPHFNLEENVWYKAYLHPDIMLMNYTHNFFHVMPSASFKDMMGDLIGTYKTFSGINPEAMSGYLDKMTHTIDNLFIQQGIKPTVQNRSNLVGLVCNLTPAVQDDESVRKLLGTENGIHNILNTNLIKAASMGQNEKDVRFSYVLNNS